MFDNAKHLFTQAAREAAVRTRKRLVAERAALRDAAGSTVVVTVARAGQNGNLFQWEHRRYGAIVVRKSNVLFPTQSSAREAGENELTGS